MKKIIIDNAKDMVRACLLENDRPIEIAVERKDKLSKVGNIYIGIVKTIIASQFAFLDIGESKNAFLYLNDNKEKYLLSKENKKQKIKKGDTLLVQVNKDETEEKGPCVTTEISFSNHYIVLLKNIENTVGVSKKITSQEEKNRLKSAVESVLQPEYSAIIRTEAIGVDTDILIKETKELMNYVNSIISKAMYIKAPALIHREENLISKTIARLLSSDVEKIILKSKEGVEELRKYLEDYIEGFSNKLEIFDEDIDLFKQFSVNVEKALNKKVWLKSGGFIIIEHTEACVVIDVNSGKFIEGKNHEKTAFITNCEAAEEAARQIRLRNLSGMILIDFINMDNEESVDKVIEKLKIATAKDRVSVFFEGVVGLGVVLLTRKKTHDPLEHILTKPCKTCGGSGRVHNI